mgnify:CR=1 FL=1
MSKNTTNIVSDSDANNQESNFERLFFDKESVESKFETYSRFRTDLRNMTEEIKRSFRDVYLEETNRNARHPDYPDIDMELFYAKVTELWSELCTARLRIMKTEALQNYHNHIKEK